MPSHIWLKFPDENSPIPAERNLKGHCHEMVIEVRTRSDR
jgi:hypothetical protein